MGWKCRYGGLLYTLDYIPSSTTTTSAFLEPPTYVAPPKNDVSFFPSLSSNPLGLVATVSVNRARFSRQNSKGEMCFRCRRGDEKRERCDSLRSRSSLNVVKFSKGYIGYLSLPFPPSLLPRRHPLTFLTQHTIRRSAERHSSPRQRQRWSS